MPRLPKQVAMTATERHIGNSAVNLEKRCISIDTITLSGSEKTKFIRESSEMTGSTIATNTTGTTGDTTIMTIDRGEGGSHGGRSLEFVVSESTRSRLLS